MKANMKSIVWILALIVAIGFTACSDDDKDNGSGGGNEQPESETVEVYDDLDYFQNCIIEIDSVGEMMCRIYGELLDDSDPYHLYIGVDDLAEAEKMFRQWIAPDIQLSTTIPTTSGLTCPLTDEQGRSQGTVYFMPGSGTSVAEVTASSDTDLKHFNRITFLLNSAWPVNASIYGKFDLGDVITHTMHGAKTSYLYEQDWTLQWVCIRRSSNGVKPMFCSTSNREYTREKVLNHLRKLEYVPGTGTSEYISEILSSASNYWEAVFNAAINQSIGSMQYWIDRTGDAGLTLYAMNYMTGKAEKYWSEQKKYILFKIDWLDDDALITALSAKSGSEAEKDEERYDAMFDGLTNTHFYSKTNRKKNGYWYVDFMANSPRAVMGYKVTTGWNNEKWKGRSPKSWKLYGTNNYVRSNVASPQWTLIAEVNDSQLGDVNCQSKIYSCTPSFYQYFRWEVYDVNGGDALQVSEFSLLFQDTDDMDEMIYILDGTQRSDGADKCEYMFNDDKSTYWYCPNEEKKDGVWFVEFCTVKSQEPTAYKLYSTYHSVGELANCHPKNWKLYGKLDVDDEWILIDERKDEDLPHEDTKANTYNITNRGEYQYYRLEISENHGGNGVFIGRFEFVY